MNYRGKDKLLPLPNGSEWAPRRVAQRQYPPWLVALVVFWVVVHWQERMVPRMVVARCRWASWEPWAPGPRHRVMLVADPQLVDANTYPNQLQIVNYFVRKISDNYLRRNHAYLQKGLDPDSTIFLGDLFDGGREWGDPAWDAEYRRFNTIFPKRVNRHTVQLLPGNHDIGYQKVSLAVAHRFAAFFGPPNDFFDIGNHTVVVLDTISLSHPDPAINAEAIAFLNNLNNVINPLRPRILLTHVPLYRFNEKQLCGPLRESTRLFPVQKGKQYQTVLDHETSQRILAAVRPTLVFSGDDHDYCDIMHSYQDKTAREITVKTVSMTNGIKYPAVQLLSLNNPKGNTLQETHATRMCYLPDPYFAMWVYILGYLLGVVALAAFYIWPEKIRRWHPHKAQLRDRKRFVASFTAYTLCAFLLLHLYST